MTQLPQIQREEWLCVCGLWHPDNYIEHGYFPQSRAKERRKMKG